MDWVFENRALLATFCSVVMLLILIMRARMHPFPALLLAGVAAGIGAGLAPAEAITSIKNGLGGTLGGIAVIIGLGAMFGVLVESGGGITALARYVTRGAGPKAMRWSLGFVGLIAAIPVFFDVALIILFPLIVGLARKLKQTSLSFGLPLLAGLAGAHAFIPPTPGPIAVAQQLQVDLGWVIMFGFICCIPAVLIGGPLYSGFATKRGWLPDRIDLEETADREFDAGLARLTLLLIGLPLLLIVIGAAVKMAHMNGPLWDFILVAGEPVVALLIACGAAAIAMRPADPEHRPAIRKALEKSLEPVGVVLLVTGAGGAFKQVLVDSGAGQSLAESTLAWGMTPLVSGFVLALLIRIAQGSATAAMITAASLTYPIAQAADLSQPQLALVAVSVAAGATACSHVNDSGFWLVNRYFQLTTAETLRSWTVASSLVGIGGFLMALILSMLV